MSFKRTAILHILLGGVAALALLVTFALTFAKAFQLGDPFLGWLEIAGVGMLGLCFGGAAVYNMLKFWG